MDLLSIKLNSFDKNGINSLQPKFILIFLLFKTIDVRIKASLSHTVLMR